ncbi:hypothetical protein [Actinoplanes sp. NPDC051851]
MHERQLHALLLGELRRALAAARREATAPADLTTALTRRLHHLRRAARS